MADISERRRSLRPLELGSAALHGLVGEVVSAIQPHTEADPVALALTFLTMFGAAVGRGPHALVGAAEHPARLFTVLVGASSKARKGTALAEVRRVFEHADPHFVQERMMGGFGSGEAVVDTAANGEDHRLLVVEPEWAHLLAVGGRDGATLSPLLRQAWDGDRLQARARKLTTVADEAHVALIGHITVEELREKLKATEQANGYANRHLFAIVGRVQLLPSGGNFDAKNAAVLGSKVQCALERAKTVGTLRRTRSAEDRWTKLYEQMAADAPEGLLGSLLARDEAQVLRLSVVYALTDDATAIDLPHLEAAIAIWVYCRSSVELIFGGRLGSPDADRLFSAILAAGASGLDGRAQNLALGRHTGADRSRERLERSGLIVTEHVETGGRPRLISRAREFAPFVQSVQSVGDANKETHSRTSYASNALHSTGDSPYGQPLAGDSGVAADGHLS